MLRRLALLAVVGLVAPAARADVTLHPLFTDHMVLQRDAAVPVLGTAAAGEKVTVTLVGGDGPATVIEATADDKGQWSAALPKTAAGTGYTLTVKAGNTVELKDVAVGDVWVCSGQSNMEWSINAAWDADKYKSASKNPSLRLFTVKKTTAAEPIPAGGDLKHLLGWKECGPDTLGGFSAVGYHFGATLQKELKVPVGLINTSWGGTPAQAWTSKAALEAVPELKYYAGQKFAPNAPGLGAVLFNAMIHPLLKFPIKGAIWYQGEANAGKAAEYYTLFPAMISDWRKQWGSDFPFYAVQLAPWHGGDADGVSWAELRDAQRHATVALKHVGLAVITDAGDLTDIHPKDKLIPGTRLARQALVDAYGKKGPAGGPVFQSAKFEDGKAICSFADVGGGLVSKYGNNQTINGFELAGSDNKFRPAKARIVGETVVVTGDSVSEPKAVRFGWRNFPVVNLFNKEGYPASPFRSDDLPLTTAGKK